MREEGYIFIWKIFIACQWHGHTSTQQLKKEKEKEKKKKNKKKWVKEIVSNLKSCHTFLQTYEWGHTSVQQTPPHVYYIHDPCTMFCTFVWIVSLPLKRFFRHINRHRSYAPWWLVACFLRVSCLTIHQCPTLPLHSFNSSSVQKLITCRINVYPQERKAKSKLLYFAWEPLAPLILEPIIKFSSKKFPVGLYGKPLEPGYYCCLNNHF